MTLGAFGSTMEGLIPRPFPSAFQYVQLPQGVTDLQLRNLAAVLPLFCTSLVGMAPQRVLNPALIAETEGEN